MPLSNVRLMHQRLLAWQVSAEGWAKKPGSAPMCKTTGLSGLMPHKFARHFQPERLMFVSKSADCWRLYRAKKQKMCF